MTVVNGVGGTVPARPAPARRPGASGFRVQPETAAGVAGPSAVTIPSLLGLQESQQDAVGDRDARRHAGQMLESLTDMQRALLSGTGTAAGLERLARLARQAPLAADPGLAGVQRALLVRVAVERARGQVQEIAAKVAASS